MKDTNPIGLIAIIFVAVVAAAALAFFLIGRDTAVAPPKDTINQNGLLEAQLGQTITALGVTLIPTEVVEDSRCPTDVTCIQAGRVRLRASLISGLGTANQIFTIGEPITTEAEEITLIAVRPAPVSTTPIKNEDYRFVFKILKREMTYSNATSDMIRVTTPKPGSVTGKEFKIVGEARGNWFFEASFPIEVHAASGGVLTVGIAQAIGEWMTTDFVPYSADIVIPATYTGAATIVLKKDNPSGEPRFDASVSYPITIEY